MFVFSDLSSLFSSINPVLIMNRVFSDPKIQDLLIEAIQLRLSEKGITASGKKLETDQSIRQDQGKVYSVFNIEKANRKFVDLYSEGDFYESFNIEEKKSGFLVDANFEKENGHIARNFALSYFNTNEFEKDILSPVHDEFFKDFAKEDVTPVFIEVFTEFFTSALKRI